MNLPIGMQLNNPGHVERFDKYGKEIPWTGLADVPLHPRFATFRNPFYGARAMARVLINYQERYNLFTIDTMLARYAEENRLERLDPYDICVAKKLGIDFKNDRVDLDKHLRPMMMEMVRVEQGMEPYTEVVYDIGIAEAKLP